jgi:hypothetical protein
MASFFAQRDISPGSSYRDLLLVPNSLAAQQRDRETNFVYQLLAALLFLLPALAFSGLLSWQVARDAARMGLSRRGRWLWTIGTLALGLPVHITYRLTRPKAVLTLCRNCGRERRVDLDTCHHCGSGWDQPVLVSPAWRVTSR